MVQISEHIRERISKIPMVMVVIPFAMGIFFAESIILPLWIIFVACIAGLVGIVMLSQGQQTIATCFTIFATGALLHSISYRGETTYNTPLEMEIEMHTSSTLRNGGYTSAEALVKWCEDGSVAGKRVVVWGDSLVRLRAGDRLLLTTPIRPFRKGQEQYAKLMLHRGFVGSISLSHNSTYGYSPTKTESLHDKAVTRLQSAMTKGDARAVVLAMSIGEKCELSSELRRNYSASGVSHLLAVSGLHIGIAFLLINIVLLPLVLLRYGNVARSILAVVLIWLYVWLCGASPSAVRAAIMFSLLQLSISSLRGYTSINILAGAAFLMLAFDSHLLFDISFQLSFIAVAAILLWAMPLYRFCATRFKLLNSLLGVLLIGIASTLATIPIVSHTFSVVSVVGILINPLVILLANIIVLCGIIALLFPPLATMAEWVASLQNSIVIWAANLPYGHYEVSVSEGAMWGIYILFMMVTLAIWLLPKRKKVEKIEDNY